MDNTIQIIEKPEWVSWDVIHDVLWAAHAENRNVGIIMSTAFLSGEELKKKIEGRGTMFVALIQGKVVATAAIIKMKASLWCVNGECAYMGFASVLPEYKGKGIYKALCLRWEEEAKRWGVNYMLLNTHSNNNKVIAYNLKNGYKCVDIIKYDDHINVKMVKWMNGCPYSDWYIKIQFKKQILYRYVKHWLLKLYHLVRSTDMAPTLYSKNN